MTSNSTGSPKATRQPMAGWRRFMALQRAGLGPVERAFFEEQHKHTISTIRTGMVLGLMLWIIQTALEYTYGIAHPTTPDVIVRVIVAFLLGAICLLYTSHLSSSRGHIFLSFYATIVTAGLMVSLALSPDRWPYSLVSLVALSMVIVSMWTRMRWMFIGLLPLAAFVIIACRQGLFPSHIVPLIGFYIIIAGVFGLLLRSGRIRPAFEVFVLRQHLMRKALLDPLTQVWNRAGWEARLDAVEGAPPSKHRACVLFIDLDHFKKVNDRHGHEQGDIVLRKVAETIANTLRGEDVFARIGGEEFSAWLAGIDPPQAAVVAERIRRRVAALKFPYGVTVSIGMSCVSHDEDVRDAVRRADEALLLAKESGRNRVWCWGQEGGKSPETEAVI